LSSRSAEPATFVIERTYDATPARVFGAWSQAAAKERWFSAPEEMGPRTYTLDFRVGGHEVHRVGPAGGPVYSYNATYHDIVPNGRIVYTYTMDRDDARLSVSVATIEFTPAERGTRLVLTEQGVFLDATDKVEYREHGTGELLDKLALALRETAASAP
jgi:uncharacterized protein YndB with AHSA1/START domain